MLQRILHGEWYSLRIYLDRDINGGFGICFYWRWRSYANAYGLPKTPWDDFLFDCQGIPF